MKHSKHATRWNGLCRMNSIQNRAEEILLNELVYA